MRQFITTSLCLVGGILLWQGLYMETKAKLAQVLIASSWEVASRNQQSVDQPPPKPWWWADTRAIAKLEALRLEKTVYVMQDDSGESLAFGPGHMPASAFPSRAGHVMIAGHRDSHFEFLRDIKVGDIIKTTNYQSETKRYRVGELTVIDARKDELRLVEQDHLSLITCFPFDDITPGGPLRLVISASAVSNYNSIKMVAQK